MYTDVQTGKSDARRQFNCMMEMVKKQQINEVIVTRIDRLGRSLLSCRKALDQFRAAKVKLTILDGDIDLSTVAGRTHANIMVVFAEMESEMISERSRHGWDYLRGRKVAMHPPFGYVKADDRHQLDHRPFLSLLGNRQEMSRAAIARDTVEIFLEVKSLRATIKRINLKYGLARFNHAGPKTGFTAGGIFQWSSSGLRNWLTNPVLCGHLVYLRDQGSPKILYDTHPDQKLLSEEEFREIQLIIDHNRSVRGWGFKALKYPLSGLIFCHECGGNCYSLSSGNKSYYYFQCKNYRMNACTSKKAIRMDLAEEVVVAALVAQATKLSAIASISKPPTESLELQQLRAQLATLNGIPGNNPAIHTAIADLKDQIENLTRKRETVSIVQQENQQLLLEAFSERALWTTSTDDEKRKLFRVLVDRAIVRDGYIVEIRLKV